MKKEDSFRQKGIPYIFTAGLGLLLTLAMAGFMISVILVKALGFFWPSQLQWVTMKDGSSYLGEKYDEETTAGKKKIQLKKWKKIQKLA